MSYQNIIFSFAYMKLANTRFICTFKLVPPGAFVTMSSSVYESGLTKQYERISIIVFTKRERLYLCLY